MASETTFTNKKIDYWTKVTSIIVIVGKFRGGGGGGGMPVRGDIPWFPPLNKSLLWLGLLLGSSLYVKPMGIVARI